MAVRLNITTRRKKQGGNLMVLRSSMLLLLVMYGLIAAERTAAQVQERWSCDSLVGIVAPDKPFVLDPQVAIDRWGNRHYAWVTYDPNSSGYQAFYANDVTGVIGTPFLATDIGTIYYDSVGVDSSMIFLLDRNANSHFLFLANVPGPNGQEIGLYYTGNRDSELRERNPILLTNNSGRYDMAVDSAGVVHVVWLERKGSGSVEMWYWNSLLTPAQRRRIDSIPCGTPACRFSDPQIEANADRLEVFVRLDPGTIFHTRVNTDGTSTPPVPLPIPTYDPQLVAKGNTDLHLRSAVDPFGAFHLLFPCHQAGAPQPELFYVTNAQGTAQYIPLVTIDSTLRGFDVATDGSDRMTAVWTLHRGRYLADRPMTGIAEYRRDPGGLWQQIGRINDLNTVAGNPDAEWRVANRLAIVGDRVCISGLSLRDTNQTRMASFVRSSVRPQSVYMLPDAGAPGMSVVVETFAPPSGFGSFGRDTLDPANVGLELVDAADSSRIVIGPSVVSWDGRLLSTMLFIRHDAAPGDVALRVRVGNRVGNQQVFHVVTPQRLGVDGSGNLSGGGVLGSGGIYGTRSPRGVLVVDSLVLTNGTYRAYYNDIDPSLEGNQGMLPLTILARGPIVIDSTAILTVSAPVPSFDEEYGIAGPGGGGGGAGLRKGRGEGFTAGGGPSQPIRDTGFDGRMMGSGGESSGRYVAGGSIGGAHGGAARRDVPSGGGTGHPFGASGRYGGADSLAPVKLTSNQVGDPGGFGAGTGGNVNGIHTNGGGGGGYAMYGGHGGIANNGGRPVGSTVVVPLAGGSGGGGAYSVRGHASGGGGGGALALYSYREIFLLGEIHADGGDGLTDNSDAASGGGGGSGGGVLIGTKDRLLIGRSGKISAAGGKGGEMHIGTTSASRGGDGSVGRIRLDGQVDYGEVIVEFAEPRPEYYGPSTGMNGSFRALGNDSIAGTGIPGKRIRVYVRPKFGAWSYDRPRDVIVNDSGEWGVELTPGEAAAGLVYAAAMQQVDDPTSDPWTARPGWVMSSAGGNIVGRPAAGFNAERVDFGCISYPECKTMDVVITNTGEQSDLQIYTRSLNGSDWFSIVSQDAFLRIGPGERRTIQIKFCPGDTGIANAELRLNTNLYPNPVRTIPLSGCGISGLLGIDLDTIDLGELCPNSCLDTTVVLRNEGEGTLRVTGLEVDQRDLTVELLAPSLPIEIPSGESRPIRLRACLKGGDGDLKVGFKAVTAPSIRTQGLMLRVRNMGPQPEFPAQIDFGSRDIGRGDSCRADTFQLKNRSLRHSMTIDALLVNGNGFTILSPEPGVVIPPNDSVAVVVRFCTEEPGDYTGLLGFSLHSSQCSLDTAVALDGSVIRSLPELYVESPRPQSINFGSVPIGSFSPDRDITIFNRGVGDAHEITYSVEPAEFTIVPATGPPGPFDLEGVSRRSLIVRVVPSDIGTLKGQVKLRAADGWEDSVELIVTGVNPDVVTDTLYLDFGEVRKGSSSDRALRILNKGSLVDTIVGFAIADSTHFSIQFPTSPVRMELKPGSEIPATLRFTPRDTGTWNDTLTVFTQGGVFVVPVVLTGRGLLEKADADAGRIEFDCDSLIKTLTVRNTGSWPLTITGVDPGGRDWERFRMLDQPSPDIVGPGESRAYRVEYVPGARKAEATLVIQHSVGQMIVDLSGQPCEDEQIQLTFTVPDLEGTVGSIVNIPVELQIEGPAPEDIPFRLQLNYEWSLLVPESLVSRQKVAGAEIVDGLEIGEVEPGETTIKGTIKAGTGSGTLFEIPMRALLGRTYRTDLVLSEMEPDGLPAAYRVLFNKGSFVELDCDTTGTVDISGRYVIKQNAPNPFNGGTTIGFEIARREHVRILLYDASGNLKARLVDQLLDRGEHELSIIPGTFPAGLYFYEITSGRFRDVKSMLIVE